MQAEPWHCSSFCHAQRMLAQMVIGCLPADPAYFPPQLMVGDSKLSLKVCMYIKDLLPADFPCHDIQVVESVIAKTM